MDSQRVSEAVRRLQKEKGRAAAAAVGAATRAQAPEPPLPCTALEWGLTGTCAHSLEHF